MEILLKSTITFPVSGHEKEEIMLGDARVIFYKYNTCSNLINQNKVIAAYAALTTL